MSTISNDLCYDANPFKRIAGYARVAMLLDPDNPNTIRDAIAFEGLAEFAPDNVTTALGYREASSEQRAEFIESIKELWPLIVHAWHINQPIKPQHKMTFPVVLDCGFSGKWIFQLDAEGACKIEPNNDE